MQHDSSVTQRPDAVARVFSDDTQTATRYKTVLFSSQTLQNGAFNKRS